MRAFSFHIDPHASFDRRDSRRKWGRIGFAFNLGMLWNAFRLLSRKPEASKQTAPHRRSARFLRSSREFLAARQTRHHGYPMSAVLRSDGQWIASFGCPDGRPLDVGGSIQPVCVSRPYRAECLALAEAQLRIEALGNS